MAVVYCEKTTTQKLKYVLFMGIGVNQKYFPNNDISDVLKANRLMVFERKILRKIFGPTYENGSWRLKTNQELDKIIKHKNIINFARAQRLGWYGHIQRMQERRMVKAIHSWKPISKRPTGRPKVRWEDDVKKDIQRLKVPNWKTF
jgi:hypothetical protein